MFPPSALTIEVAAPPPNMLGGLQRKAWRPQLVGGEMPKKLFNYLKSQTLLGVTQ